jgi:hypothetical protein
MTQEGGMTDQEMARRAAEAIMRHPSIDYDGVCTVALMSILLALAGAARREGIEAAARWHDGQASMTRVAIAEDEADGRTTIIRHARLRHHEHAADRIRALLDAPADDGWRTMDSAPRDGTVITAEVVIEGRIQWSESFMDDDEAPCGGWVWVDDREPPPDWSEGACWSSNADEVASTPPTRWRVP